MSFKSRVFIGSASESLDQAKKVKELLAKDFNAYVWTDDVFTSNESALDALLNAANLFDFGVMVLSKDDHVKSRKEKFEKPRDNTVFEFGLFLGRLGPGRAFAIAEDGVDLPSDLDGITIEKYDLEAESGHYLATEECVRRIAQKIRESENLAFLGVLSETALAIGYFNNFVRPLAERIGNREKTNKGIELKKLNIVLPTSICSDMRTMACAFYARRTLDTHVYAMRTRSLEVRVERASAEAIDFPTTLEGVGRAIDLCLHEPHIGKSVRRKLLEAHQLSSFRRALEALIQDDAFAKDHVSIVDESLL